MGDNKDVWRDSALRYAGYANEVGEAFRYQFPRGVIPSYCVAMTYVVGDAVDKTKRALDAGERSAVVAYTAADVFLWQTLASVALPGVAIHRVVYWSRKAMAPGHAAPGVVPAAVANWAPSAIGLAVIPFIIHPIDTAVDILLDNTTRPLANFMLGTVTPSAPSAPTALPAGGSGFSSLPVSAAVPELGTRCAEAHRAFKACKEAGSSAGACGVEGSAVFACAAGEYQACLGGNGGEGDVAKSRAKCQGELGAMRAVLASLEESN